MIDSSTAPRPGPGTDVHVPEKVPTSLRLSKFAEPLPQACMAGTCACPSAPDGHDQHQPPASLAAEVAAGLHDQPHP